MIARVSLMTRLACCLGIRVVIEQPGSSLMCRHPRWVQMLDGAFVELYQLHFPMAAFGGSSLKPTLLYSNDITILQALECHERTFNRKTFSPTVTTSTVVKKRAGVAVTGAPGLKSTQPGPRLRLRACLAIWLVL